MLPAVICMGIFVSILIEIGWGTDLASFMNVNIASVLHWGIGNTEVLVYGLMLVFTIIFGVEMIGFGTLANMFLIGYIIDFCQWIWLKTGFHDFIVQGTFTQNLIIFAVTILLFVLVAAIYMNAQMGVAPYDVMPKIISDWIPKVPFSVIRILFDLSAVAIGVLFGCLNTDAFRARSSVQSPCRFCLGLSSVWSESHSTVCCHVDIFCLFLYYTSVKVVALPISPIFLRTIFF